MEMAKTLKAIDPCLYDKLMQVYRANEILRMQEESCLDKTEQDIQPTADVTFVQDGGQQERSHIGSSDAAQRISEDVHDDVDTDDVAQTANDSTLEHHAIPGSSHSQQRSIEGWTTVESIRQPKKRKKTPRNAPRKRLRKYSYRRKTKRKRC